MIVSRVSISAVILTPNFSNVADLDHCRHQTHTQNINAISTTNADTPHDNTGKLQIDKSNLNVTLWTCMKKSDYFWTRVS